MVGGLSMIEVKEDGSKFDLTMADKDLVVDLFKASGRDEITEESDSRIVESLEQGEKEDNWVVRDSMPNCNLLSLSLIKILPVDRLLLVHKSHLNSML